MDITYLGTAAAEGWPGIFCRCEHCMKAIKLKGKNIRTRSQVLINKDLLVDIPPDSYAHMLTNEIDFSAIKYLLITHSHSDHFYPIELCLRGGYYAKNMTCAKIHIYSNQEVKNDFDKITKKELLDFSKETFEWHIIKPFDKFSMGEYTITALPAKHTRIENDLLYLIEYHNKTMFFCNDTGRIYDSIYEYMVNHKIHIDLVSFDCTSGPMECGDDSGHMGIPDNLAVKEKLVQLGVCDDHTKYIITHFSHNSGLMHDELVDTVKQYNFDVAYDSKKVTI